MGTLLRPLAVEVVVVVVVTFEVAAQLFQTLLDLNVRVLIPSLSNICAEWAC